MKAFVLPLISLLVLTPVVGWSSPLCIGGTTIEIPNPPGFVPVTPQMPSLHRFAKLLETPGMEEFIRYIAESEVPTALKDEIPEMARSFSVQTSKELIHFSTSKSQFVLLKQGVKTRLDKIVKEAEKDMPGVAEKFNKGMTQEFGVDPALSVSNSVTLAPHEETDRMLAFSAFSKLDTRNEAGNAGSKVVVSTVTFLHVKAKVLYLYAYGQESNLAWGRTASRQWADSILAANPPDALSSAKEPLPPPTRGINLDKMAQQGVVAGLVAAIVLAIVYLGAWVMGRASRKEGKNTAPQDTASADQALGEVSAVTSPPAPTRREEPDTRETADDPSSPLPAQAAGEKYMPPEVRRKLPAENAPPMQAQPTRTGAMSDDPGNIAKSKCRLDETDQDSPVQPAAGAANEADFCQRPRGVMFVYIAWGLLVLEVLAIIGMLRHPTDHYTPKLSLARVPTQVVFARTLGMTIGANFLRYCQMLWMRFLANASFALVGRAEMEPLRGGPRSFHPPNLRSQMGREVLA